MSVIRFTSVLHLFCQYIGILLDTEEELYDTCVLATWNTNIHAITAQMMILDVFS